MSPKWGGTDRGDTNPVSGWSMPNARTSVTQSWPRYLKFNRLMVSSSVTRTASDNGVAVSSLLRVRLMSSTSAARSTFVRNRGSVWMLSSISNLLVPSPFLNVFGVSDARMIHALQDVRERFLYPLEIAQG